MTTKKAFIIGAIITSILGVIGHFLYEWSNENKFVALFCAVNESTQEHLKLLFFPFLLWIIISHFVLNDTSKEYFRNGAISCFSGLLSIVVIFYTYTGVLGYSIDFINIAIYFIGVIISFYILYRLEMSQKSLKASIYYGILFFIIMSFLFFIFTSAPPYLGLFISPV